MEHFRMGHEEIVKLTVRERVVQCLADGTDPAAWCCSMPDWMERVKNNVAAGNLLSKDVHDRFELAEALRIVAQDIENMGARCCEVCSAVCCYYMDEIKGAQRRVMWRLR